MRSIFVSTANALLGDNAKPWGGVQVCTNEYLTVLRHAGFDVTIVKFDFDQRLSNRIVRKLRRRPYLNLLPPDLENIVFNAIDTAKAKVVFLNLMDLAPLAKTIRKKYGAEVKVILLSHGQGCADILHEIRFRCLDKEAVTASSNDLRWLGGHLVAECQHRKYIDHVFCLSEFDIGLERWVGAQSVSWLPRIVTPNPLPWAPMAGRVGFVGSLGHPPNTEGLELFLKVLDKRDGDQIKVRLIGGQERYGHGFARRHRNVDYLGQLADDQAEAEASTWACALHPLFCWSKGCSTKLAVMLGWHIPIVATVAGCRGYTWKEGGIPQAETPEAFAEMVERVANRPAEGRFREDIVKAAQTSPSIEEVARLVIEHLRHVCRF